jgi:hypothetical protein
LIECDDCPYEVPRRRKCPTCRRYLCARCMKRHKTALACPPEGLYPLPGGCEGDGVARARLALARPHTGAGAPHSTDRAGFGSV